MGREEGGERVEGWKKKRHADMVGKERKRNIGRSKLRRGSNGKAVFPAAFSAAHTGWHGQEVERREEDGMNK
ncbi:hypothetical protein P170DRAFT_94956 [Aspergillus steynii IBT 23096]|uniref:Uncharacterized protein n=1 Tax=Aspergillus steynii IBT 23096 TaxID=1392250 RepID=A0A2I2GGH4_9EURO|nr:uncharacterized protein P170DRAFT_94956 [Aspergillus steynii IBT 23096]PLB51982.1 hypothetical protein P170DRAFT_94956 [Aspergillus steynii IBT 23096]